VERRVDGGTIGWLIPPPRRPASDRHRPQGVRPDRAARRLRPSRHSRPRRLPYRIAITLNTSPHGTKPIGVCTWQLGAGGAAGGCQRLQGLFASAPITSGLGGGGSSEYSTLAGLASNDVARITAYLSNGQTEPVALNDNAYLAELPRSALPARLVAYNSQG
jgi:hypothetical protein